MKDTQKSKVLAITGMASMSYVMPNVAADAEGHVVSENGLIALVEAVESGETAQAALVEAQNNLAAAKTNFDTLNASLTTAQASLETANAKVTTLEAKIATYGKLDGANFSAANSKNDADGNLKPEFLTSIDAELKEILEA